MAKFRGPAPAVAPHSPELGNICELTIVAFFCQKNISSFPLLTDSDDLLIHYRVPIQLMLLKKS
jgi:hypothetical protein